MKLQLHLSLRAFRYANLSHKNSAWGNSVRNIYLLHEGDYSSSNQTDRVTEVGIREKLKEFTVPFKDGQTCFFVEGCGLCHKTSSKSNSSKSTGIYINKKTGFFVCDKCSIFGNWSVLSDFLTKTKDSKNETHLLLKRSNSTHYEKIGNDWKEVVSQTFPLHQSLNFSEVFEKFNLLPCSKTNAEMLGIRVNADLTQIYLPFKRNKAVVGYKVIDINSNVNTFPAHNCPGFLKSPTNYLKGVIVADVSDFFALLSQHLKMDILCLPYGASHLPQATLPFLEQYQSLIFWFGGAKDLDATGNFAMKLGSKRCSVVKPTNNQVSAVTAVEKKENISQILEAAKSAWHEAVINFSDLREEVLAELQNKEQCSGIKWKKFPILNKILKGHRRGELTVLTGPTGSGKTTFTSEYSLDLAMQGVNTLWGSFEIKNPRLAKKMLQQFAGIPMEENLEKFDYWANKFEELPIYFLTFYGQNPLKTVMEAVEHCAYVHDIAHVIIDNVQFMIDISPDSMNMDRFWKQDVLIQRFRSFASKFNCHVTLIMHPKKGMDGLDLSVNSIFGGAKAAQEADNILIIQNKYVSCYETKKILQICKNRYSGDLGTMPLIFDKSSFGFSANVNQNEISEVEPNEMEMKENWNTSVDDYMMEMNQSRRTLRMEEHSWNRLMHS